MLSLLTLPDFNSSINNGRHGAAMVAITLNSQTPPRVLAIPKIAHPARNFCAAFCLSAAYREEVSCLKRTGLSRLTHGATSRRPGHLRRRGCKLTCELLGARWNSAVAKGAAFSQGEMRRDGRASSKLHPSRPLAGVTGQGESLGPEPMTPSVSW